MDHAKESYSLSNDEYYYSNNVAIPPLLQDVYRRLSKAIEAYIASGQ